MCGVCRKATIWDSVSGTLNLPGVKSGYWLSLHEFLNWIYTLHVLLFVLFLWSTAISVYTLESQGNFWTGHTDDTCCHDHRVIRVFCLSGVSAETPRGNEIQISGKPGWGDRQPNSTSSYVCSDIYYLQTAYYAYTQEYGRLNIDQNG